MLRRSLLLLPLTGCSVLPDRPYQEVRRFALAPERPAQATPAPNAPVLLLRGLRAAPGLEARGLRRVGAGGLMQEDPYAEWAAPPAELAEEALRRWLLASGRFRAVTAPGSRLRAPLVLEAELLRLQVEPGAARAGLAALLLAEENGREGARVLGQFTAEGRVPFAGGDAVAEAAAMNAALGAALAGLEARLPR